MSQQPEKVTAQSIALAKATQLRERFNVMRETGVVIRPDGTLVLPPLVSKPKAHRPKRWYCQPCSRWFMSRVDCPKCGLALLRAH